MIKFFRKIRQKLLSENKFSKYLIYAIGEIVLVVIGILIALQINNWNEQRKTQSNQEKYLILLKTEALNNLKEINKTKKDISSMKLEQTEIFNLIDGDQDTITDDYLSKSLFKVITRTYSFRYENSALSELKSSGDLKNVLNDTLRKYLIALEPLVLKIQKQEQNVIDVYDETLAYVKRNGSLRMLIKKTESEELLGIPKSTKSKSSNIHLLSEDEFENILINYIGTTNNIISNNYPELENHLKKIIKIIEKELE